MFAFPNLSKKTLLHFPLMGFYKRSWNVWKVGHEKLKILLNPKRHLFSACKSRHMAERVMI